MSEIKTAAELELMRTGGQKLHMIREKLLEEIKVGVEPLQIDALAKKLIQESGATPSFVTVGDYKWATCICVNDAVVHGIPTTKSLVWGDVVSLDVGLLYQGFHTDTSWTKIVRSLKLVVPSETEKFVKIGEIALEKAILEAKPGNRVGHISKAIQEIVEGAGYSVVKTLVGHGVGRQLHESPHIPGLLTQPLERTPELKTGMVLAIEVIYNMGGPEIVYKNDDGWTLATADGSLSGLYEQTVAVTPTGPIVLT
ncbi:MAG: Methionine aminopeptidase [Candidatus Gottesmanbacteria bacterium GW2011_GWB1_43_11]|uniref:Methionine aminopeptidase n=1 Tax=Candidatus Gottesmanbacteria bacterium GW2011_GWB1_43_11 TaxID=1618446 RepID=A0A0G1CMY7_9BACT|nr:MAG: Methionine aminopeptidase [Candidatus Gottesmanbacteria bacterium GW2011_GWA2_42_16]KKS55757.1 MAG: Methionine aminopeptidase [Candidatus Gottesmanbacteria bacterium GW2011_GWA1_42_26]KKS81937.1 MAG: methionine aminopeptidase, type I, methionyl aminopeptidase [Candidatus Gottesmanbacteria bacterium GW2011_GWC1_43_10]KKS86857.1 MAG: Methionine aminopeptidase [Candidatus Gottesmanbacteria bacterium GW2011_GWB1_43_11]OGG10489.1 MAG: type I methionyl aminopeptidase [Candidatus Gottesmanbact